MPRDGSRRSGGSPADRRGQVLGRVGGASLWNVLTDPSTLSTGLDPIETVRLDVMRNLAVILNANRDRCFAFPDFGLPNISELFAGRRSAARIAKEIKACVERWEPRLATPVEVRVDEASMADAAEGVSRAPFVVRAKLAAPWNELCTFRTMVVADGNVEVS